MNSVIFRQIHICLLAKSHLHVYAMMIILPNIDQLKKYTVNPLAILIIGCNEPVKMTFLV